MKTVQNETLGLNVAVSVPSTVEEFDQLAGRAGAALDEATKNVMYRSWNPEFKSAFFERIEKETGVKRALDEDAMAKAPARADGTKAPIYVKDSAYINALKAAGHDFPAAFQQVANEVAAGIPLDPSPGSRGGGGRIGKEFLNAAQGILDSGAVAKVVANLTANGINVNVGENGNPTVEDLARGIKAFQDKKLAEATAALGV